MLLDSAEHGSTAPSAPPPGIIARAVGQLRQFVCGLHGHDALLHFEQTRVSLQCTSCGYQTPGWDLKTKPVKTEDRQQPAPRVIRLPLVGERHVA